MQRDDPDAGGDALGRRFAWALARDLRLAMRTPSELGVQLLFYVVVATLFPLASSPDRALLAALGPGVIWVAALLASFLSLPRLFALRLRRRHARADGAVALAAAALVSGKIAAHWMTTGLPLMLLSPLLALQYGLDAGEIGVLAAGLALGTPILSLLGAIGAALTLGARGGGAARAAGAAALRAGADLRRRRGRGVPRGLAPTRTCRCSARG